MKIDLKSLLIGAALVLIGYFMGLMGSNRLFAQYLPDTIRVNLYTPSYLDIKHHSSLDVNVNGSLDIDEVDGDLTITQF